MRFKKADRQPEGLPGMVVYEANGARNYFHDPIARSASIGIEDFHVVVSNRPWVFGNMLQADQCRIVTGLRPESPHDVVPVTRGCHGEAAIYEPQHAVAVRTLTGEQACPAGGAGWRGIVRMPEENPLLCKALEVGSGNGVSIRAGEAAGIVGMDVKDVGTPSRCRLRMKRLRDQGSSHRAGCRSLEEIPPAQKVP